MIRYRQIGVREQYAVYQSPGDDVMESLAGIVRDEGLGDVIVI